MTAALEAGQDRLRHFIDLNGFGTPVLRRILDVGHAYRRGEAVAGRPRPLEGKTLAMIFEKPSTRTRVSFQVGMRQLGGDVVVLTQNDTQLGRGETIADTARVLSRYVDAIMLRTTSASNMRDMAEYATVPVINGLTDNTHPCQVMADLMTFEQHRGSLSGKVVAWCGDGNNVAASWIQASAHFGFSMRLACPERLAPRMEDVLWARSKGARVELTTDPREAARGADCIVTDTWLSMGTKDVGRAELLRPYRVDAALMGLAKPEALFMHCLPAHRGDEVTDEVMDGPQSVVWDEAENRLHVQKSILTWCLT